MTQIVTSGDFAETDNCAGTAVMAGAACAVQVEFLPTATGARIGLVTIYGNVAGGQATAALSGVGAPAAAIVLNPISVTYSGTNVGSASAPQNITISNTGGVTATLQAPAVSGDFAITANTCGPTLAAGVGCTVSVAFQPTASGTRNGAFSVTDSVGTQTASLTGAGLLPATDTLAPLTLTFTAQQLNTASGAQQVTLTNAGDAALTGIAAQIASGGFTVVNGCGNSLNGHSTCALLVVFVPTSVGANMGVLTVSDEYRSQTVSLGGVGIAPPGVSLSPVSTMTFAATGVGLNIAAQTVTADQQRRNAAVDPEHGDDGGFCDCCREQYVRNEPGGWRAQCTAQVSFTPTAAGTRVGSLTVADNAGSSPQSLQLTGMGVDFALSASGSTLATIAAGAEAVYPLLLTSVAGVPGTVEFTCSGVPANAICTVTPATPALGGSTAMSVTVATSVTGAALKWPVIPGGRQMVWLAGLLPLGLLGAGRKRLRGLGRLVTIGCVLILAGCGASRLIPETSTGGSSGTPTPSGTYNLTVVGTSAGLTRSVGLTLVVQ